jgi:hypothetical protein
MMAIFTSMVVIAWGYPPKSRFLPLVIGIPGIALTLLQLWLDLWKSPNSQGSTSGPKRTALQKIQDSLSTRLHRKMDLDITREKLTVLVAEKSRTDSTVWREIVLFGYFFGLIAGVVLFGFWLTIPVFLIAFLRLHERDNWMFILSLTGVAWLTIYLIFDRLLEIFLHTGLISQYLIELLPE